MILRRFASSAASSSRLLGHGVLGNTIKQVITAKQSAVTPARSTGEGRKIPESEELTVSGWIKSIRKQKNRSFAVITDGSTSEGLQAVLSNGIDDEIMRRLTNGTAVRVRGQLVLSPQQGQTFELAVDPTEQGEVEILGECDPNTYPIQKKSLTAEYLRDHVHLRARTSQIAQMLRLRDQLTRHIHEWFELHGFCNVNTPIITSSDAEGAGESFRLSPIDSRHPAAGPGKSTPSSSSSAAPPLSEFFSDPAFLTVSHQLHLEALATAISRVYTLSPCFRAEPSDTARHLAEFWMLEAEWAFPTKGVEEVCDVTEDLLKYAGGELLQHGALDRSSEERWLSVEHALRPSERWKHMSYSEAIDVLEKASNTSGVNFQYAPKWGRQLQSEHERWLAETYVKGPVFVRDYPVSLKPFYMRANEDGKTVECFDLLVPHVGELIGGSVREERIERLEKRMREDGLVGTGKNNSYEWYLDLRRFGGAPHAGFGMGFERLVGWLSCVDNIRECIPMPRWAGRMLL